MDAEFYTWLQNISDDVSQIFIDLENGEEPDEDKLLMLYKLFKLSLKES